MDSEAQEALADAWASIDGKLEAFRAGKGLGIMQQPGGYYSGYLADAHSMIERLERRGFVLARKEPADG